MTITFVRRVLMNAGIAHSGARPIAWRFLSSSLPTPISQIISLYGESLSRDHGSVIDDDLDAAILDAALNLSLDFGVNWRRPVAGQLLVLFPKLSKSEAEEVDRFVRALRDWAHGIIATYVQSHQPTESEVRREIEKRCSWAEISTLNKLWDQGVYYAHK